MDSLTLSSSVQFIKGVGPKLAKLLQKKGISSLEDALYFLPRAYEDRRVFTPIGQLVAGVPAVVRGRIVRARPARKGRRSSFEATVEDGTGSLTLLWFHAYPSLGAELLPGAELVIYGTPKVFLAGFQIVHPDFERVDPLKPVRAQSYQFGRIVPVYSETEGLHQKTIRRILGEAVKLSLQALEEPLPETLRQRLRLPSLQESFVAIHFPKELPGEGELSDACRRVVFEEFFVLQLGLGLKKQGHRRQSSRAFVDKLKVTERFRAGLPFQFTEDQNRALAAVLQDLASTSAMTRLVQGDVGCGKTVVALAAAAVVASQGGQTAFMAPTEILAQQHFATAQKFLQPLGIECALLVSETAQDAQNLARIESGKAQLIVGTHALFQAGPEFSALGLVVVDEQHRFGVEQRSELVRKSKGPAAHLLMMTATPIPRTLAFTLYGDLDLTVIRHKPIGRSPVLTQVYREKDRPRLYQEIRRVVASGEQAYFIYPLVEASEKLDLKSATEMWDRLRREVFPDIPIALLHGRMKSDEKERTLAEFKAGKWKILVATTVIEVGIDVPNATLMVIEHPERLGLSQLHQLRGRVGRGAKKSRCVLLVEGQPTRRLRVMEKTEDGFVIAEEDLKIRGPGEFLGTRQSGLPGFRVGHLLRDADLLELARSEALSLLESDPELVQPEHALIRKMVESRWSEKIERLRG